MNEKQWELEFRYYDLPRHRPVLCLYGDRWKMKYGGEGFFHFHNVLELGICREGSGELIYPQGTRLYSPGMVSVIPKNISHTTESAYSWWEYVFLDVDFYVNQMENSENGRETLRSRINCRPLLLEGSAYPDLYHSIEQIIREDQTGGHYSGEIIDSKCRELLYLIGRENHEFSVGITDQSLHRDRKIREALDYIEEKYAHPISVGEIAMAVNMSETNFRRVFQKIMNITPNDYVNMVRVRHACNMLTETEKPISLIGEECGFSTASTFNRNFRTLLGTTPLTWRKSATQNGKAAPGLRFAAYHGWGQENE